MAPVEEKSMVPTVLVGIGGTGIEVLARVRRLVEEIYGSVESFPLISFLVVDTDRDYKINNPEAGGTPFKTQEQLWAKVTNSEVESICKNMSNYPWINRWFPNELEKNITSLEAGAGQIRACGRFAFFVNYHEIQAKFNDAVRRVKGQEDFIYNKYKIKVVNGINVFVTGSLSGGTGSGMLIDMGYCIRKWLRTASETNASTTAIVPMPQAFANIDVGSTVSANGYAAMMELSYFSDNRVEYINQFSSSNVDEIRDDRPPFDFTYLVGTKNGINTFKLDQIREMIAQNIFLDMTSDFAPHKRSIRDNIKKEWAQLDPGGRGYSKQFMSFGLSTIEIPIAQIRASLANRLAQDLVNWWLNEKAILHPEMLTLVRGDILKRLRLSEAELLTDLASGDKKAYVAIISDWVNSIRDEINAEDKLSCTAQGLVGLLGKETGNILTFVNYLKSKVNEYRTDHFREESPDWRLHGDYFKKIYSNRDEIIQRGRQSLDHEFYSILEDRTKGPKFADSFIVTARQVFDDAEEKFRQQIDKLLAPNESNKWKQYEAELTEINEFKDKPGLSKKEKMEQYAEKALTALEGSLSATIQRKARLAGLEVITRLKDHLLELETRLNRLKQKFVVTRDVFKEKADKQANSADALTINGIKLYDRPELNSLYQNLIEQYAGASTGSQTAFEIGMNALCQPMSKAILEIASPLWKDTRAADEVMRIFDITQIKDVQDDDFRKIIYDQAKQKILDAPSTSKLKTDLTACDRLFKQYQEDTQIRSKLRMVYNQSTPLIELRKEIYRGGDGEFEPQINRNIAVLGGNKPDDPAASKLLPFLLEQDSIKIDNIKPLGDIEHHRIVFIQEIGGFSLRCIQGMQQLQAAYQAWKGKFVLAKRAQMDGKSRELPTPVHIQKEPPFWDIFPEDEQIFKRILLAKALGVLKQDVNRATEESVIRYAVETSVGEKFVDIASSWEETTQVLAVNACREDNEEIQRQINSILNSTKNSPEKQKRKQELYQQFLDYLKQRASELDRQGGKESQEYKRESNIITDVINEYGLKKATPGDNQPSSAAPVEPIPTLVIDPSSTGHSASIATEAPQSINPTSKSAIAEKIKSLQELKDLGLLNEEEFKLQKEALIREYVDQ